MYCFLKRLKVNKKRPGMTHLFDVDKVCIAFKETKRKQKEDGNDTSF